MYLPGLIPASCERDLVRDKEEQEKKTMEENSVCEKKEIINMTTKI